MVICRFFAYFLTVLSIYNLSFNYPLKSVHNNWKEWLENMTYISVFQLIVIYLNITKKIPTIGENWKKWETRRKYLVYFILTFHLYFTLPTTSTQYPYELKWQRQTISCKCHQCHYINSSRLDSTPQTEVLIEPFNALYI